MNCSRAKHSFKIFYVILCISVNLVEVDRLWLRFRQLGCDANGMLSSSVFDTDPALDDILTKNVCLCVFVYIHLFHNNLLSIVVRKSMAGYTFISWSWVMQRALPNMRTDIW